MRRVLVAAEDDASVSRRAREVLATLRAEHAFLRDGGGSFVESAEEMTWWSFGGGRANTLLARMIEADLGGRCVVRNNSLTWKAKDGKSRVALRRWLHRLRREARPDEDDALRFARLAARRRFSKFEPCLPDGLLERFLLEKALDVEAARLSVAESEEP